MHIELYYALIQIHSNVFTVWFVYRCWDFQLHMVSTILFLLAKFYFIISVQQTKQINIMRVNETTHLESTDLVTSGQELQTQFHTVAVTTSALHRRLWVQATVEPCGVAL